MSLDAGLRSLLTVILNHLDCAVVLEDDKRKILFANRLFYHLWGLSADCAVLGQKGAEITSQLAHLVGNAAEFDNLLTSIHEQREVTLGLEFHLTDGRTFMK